MGRYYTDSLMHYGTPRHSGRYKYGSGERPYQGEGGSTQGHKKTDDDIPIDSKAPHLSARQVINHVKTNVKTNADPNIPQGKGKANKSAYEVMNDNFNRSIDSAYKAVSGARDLKVSNETTRNMKAASKMSDDELRAVINRRNLERQYVQAIAEPSTVSGYEKAQQVLNTVGAVVTIAGGVAGVYSAFHY